MAKRVKVAWLFHATNFPRHKYKAKKLPPKNKRVFFCSTSAQGDITLISEAPLSSVIPSKRATADVYQLRANRAGRRIGRGHLPPRPLVYRRVHSPQRCTPRLPSSPRSRRNEGCTQMRSDGLSGGKTSADRRQTCPMPATMRQLSGVINGAPTYAAANYTAYSPITASKRRGDIHVARMTGVNIPSRVVPTGHGRHKWRPYVRCRKLHRIFTNNRLKT